MQPMKAVFHVDEPNKIEHALRNLHNFLAIAPTAELVLVINGDAITGFTDPVLQAAMAQLPTVAFHACHNAMNSHNLSEDDIPAFATIVPAGVVDLAELQSRGFAYIKP
ncbi:DsrE family protein [Furfurilactobacillus sp. WILCCON 0119]